MRRTRAFIAVPVGMLCASSALAQSVPVAPPAAKPPSAQVSQLGYFTGTWSCIGAQPFSVFGDSHETQGLAVGSYDLDGFWLVLRFTELRTGDNERPGAWVYQFGYDTVGKQYVASWTDNFGGWGTQTSSGWQDNALVLTGTYTIDGQRIPARDTFERANSTTMAHLSELQADGQWIALVSETCHRN